MTFRPALSSRTAVLAAAASLAAATALAGTAAAQPSHDPSSVAAASHAGAASVLPLGPANLPETRESRTLQPGVTLTTIVRGQAGPQSFWTVEVAIPSSSPDPDAPATALSDRPTADAAAAKLRAVGLDPRVEDVPTPKLADAGGNSLGYRVRLGSFPAKADADALRAKVIATGLGGSSIYTGWDGEPDDVSGSTGPWHVQVLTIDPKKFRGGLDASYGLDLEARETTTTLAALTGATGAINAGFFVLDPKAGAPGDPAGVAVYDGHLVSEPTDGRPALVISDNARGTAVERFGWHGEVRAAGHPLPLDGLNRVPGLIRNCGGTADDLPTSAPLHDVTCADPDELIAFDSTYAALTPSGLGAEVILDRRGTVTAIRPTTRGGAIPEGGRTIQATGAQVAPLLAAAKPGKHVDIRASLTDTRGRDIRLSRSTTIVNGGPELIHDGRVGATPKADGMAPAGNPSFYYGWVHKRNPRTIAGVDVQGRTVLITADGRNVDSLGLGIGEAAAVAKSFGLRNAINLDGGGSTTMVANGKVLNTPSDATGERPVGDALVITPTR
ncbi:phosphodiester glycosidase family protein [Streptomyces sp. SID13031]|uniref:phosphodiester glycosidase family protein n=1 Tax=Streptomyces sp. SID13031 TaxID=2706046 RepID=UPI0013C97683|nr:phosphodiester glycosidase family protein [Streptomyces sp. SID13031]NEA35873.1 sporulation domain-containing protein [Streptomyces sp. SID13031]